MEFGSSVRLNSGGNTAITVVVRNVSERLYTDEEDIDGRGEVFNGAEQLLARFAASTGRATRGGRGGDYSPCGRAALEEGTYLMRWSTPRHGGVELEFTLLKRFGVLEVGAFRERPIAPDVCCFVCAVILGDGRTLLHCSLWRIVTESASL